MTQLDKAHSNMVIQQVRPGDVLDTRVLDVMSSIPRQDFVDAELVQLAYADTRLPIGYGQTMLSPILEGRFLQALNLQAHDVVLEIGTGSGFFTAMLASLAAEVISVEYFQELSDAARERLDKLNINNVRLEVGNASKEWSLPDRVDAIVITAAFVTLPDSYLHSLKVGGRLLVVIGKAPAMSVQLIQRVGVWEWQTNSLFETVIPAMIDAEPKAEFEF